MLLRVSAAVAALVAGTLLPGPGDQEFRRARTVPVTDTLLARLCHKPGPQDPAEVTLDLFPDIRVRADASYVTIGDGGGLEWRGQVPGLPDSEVVLVSLNACDGRNGNTLLSGSIHLGDQVYDISPVKPGTIRVAQLKPGLSEAGDGRSDVVRGPRTSGAGRLRRTGDVPVVDVLVLYTPNARARAGGRAGMGTEIDTAENLANEAYAQSGVQGRLRVVRKEEAVGYHGSERVDRAQAALSDPADGVLDEANALRDQYGADLVAIFTDDAGDSGWCGMGSMPDPPTPGSDDQVWSATDVACISNQSFAHELAHNMGATHDWTTDGTASPSNPANHGFIAPSRRWRTIMSYSGPCRGCRRLVYFSNPRNVYQGERMGIPAGRPGAADNVGVLNASIPTVAAYREPRVAPPAQYDLRLDGPFAGGTAKPEVIGPYEAGTSVTVTATPHAGYRFAGWLLAGRPYGTDDTVQVPMTRDRRLVARFTEARTDPGRSVTVTAAPVAGGAVRATPPPGRLPEGTCLVLSATPYPGYTFTGWEIDGSDAGGSPQTTFTVEGDHTIVARFSRR